MRIVLRMADNRYAVFGPLASEDEVSVSGAARVGAYRTFEGGPWKHRLVGEELDLFMPAADERHA